MEYLVVIEKVQNNYSAYAPEVPGCVTTGTTVEQTRNHIGIVIAPHQLRPHRLDVLLDALENRSQAVFRVVEKPDQQFHLAVASAAAEASDTGIEHVGAPHDRLHGVAAVDRVRGDLG